MAIDRFQHLCLRLCDKLRLARFALGDSGSGSMGFTLKRQGVGVSVLYYPRANEKQAVMTFDFAALPHDDPRVPQIMSAMVDTHSAVALSLETIDRSVSLALEWRRAVCPSC